MAHLGDRGCDNRCGLRTQPYLQSSSTPFAHRDDPGDLCHRLRGTQTVQEEADGE